jgi:HSP20 family protein
MTAQNQTSTTQKSQEDQRRQESGLARRNAPATMAPLFTDSFDLFNPFSMMRRMQEELSRAFSSSGTNSSSNGGSTLWIPPIEVAQKDGNYVVSAELPGLSDEDVTVEIDDEAIVIRGERQFEHTETQGGITRTERRYGEFYRAVPLPDGADTTKARAEFKDGVLQIRVPVQETKSNVRQIPIQSTASSQSNRPQSATSQGSESEQKNQSARDQKAA